MSDTNLKNKKMKLIFFDWGSKLSVPLIEKRGLRYRNETTERKRKVRTLKDRVARRSMLKTRIKLPINRRQHTVIIGQEDTVGKTVLPDDFVFIWL